MVVHKERGLPVGESPFFTGLSKGNLGKDAPCPAHGSSKGTKGKRMKQKRLSLGNGVLLIIDPQEKLLPKVFQPERITANMVLLIRFARIVGLPMVMTTQYRKGIGPIVEEIAQEASHVRPLDKVEFGCFNNASFRGEIRQLGDKRKVLVVAGIESHICVTQTVLGALERGYAVHVASDAVSSRTEWNRNVGLERMKVSGAVMSSTEMAIYELLERSDSPWFKEILPDLRTPVV
jgi:nicotinamidase-related amidase